jgi:hypothetical protein
MTLKQLGHGDQSPIYFDAPDVLRPVCVLWLEWPQYFRRRCFVGRLALDELVERGAGEAQILQPRQVRRTQSNGSAAG